MKRLSFHYIIWVFTRKEKRVEREYVQYSLVTLFAEILFEEGTEDGLGVHT